MNRDKLNTYLKKYIFDDNAMLEKSIEDVYQRLKKIFDRKEFKSNFNSIRNNWLELPIEEVSNNILTYMSEFSIIV